MPEFPTVLVSVGLACPEHCTLYPTPSSSYYGFCLLYERVRAEVWLQHAFTFDERISLTQSRDIRV